MQSSRKCLYGFVLIFLRWKPDIFFYPCLQREKKNGGVSSDKHPALLFIFSKRVDVIFSSVCDKEIPKGSGHCMSTIWKIFTKWGNSGWNMSICNTFQQPKPPMCKIMARQILLWCVHYICTFSLGDTSLSGNWKHRGVNF